MTDSASGKNERHTKGTRAARITATLQRRGCARLRVAAYRGGSMMGNQSGASGRGSGLAESNGLMQSILDLPEGIQVLGKRSRELFEATYRVRRSEGPLQVPDSMKSWVQERFGSQEAVESQRLIKIFDRHLFRGAVFNPIRARRPCYRPQGDSVSARSLEDFDFTQEPFSNAEALTPNDLFERVRGKDSLSASNVAKVEGSHGVIIFNNPHPLHFDRQQLHNHFAVAREWIARAHRQAPGSRHAVIGWNALWKAGASLMHGHMQTLLAQDPFPIFEQLRHVRPPSSSKTPPGYTYLDHLAELHGQLGLGARFGDHSVFATITPRKEKETWILSPQWDESVVDRIFQILRTWIDELGVRSFNMVCAWDLDVTSPRSENKGPIWTCLIDRGSLEVATDIGFIELLLQQGVLSDDPVSYWRTLSKILGRSP